MKDNPDIVVLEYQELSNFFLSVNMGANGLGFNDLRVRQAISHAIDHEAIVKSIFLGHAVATYGPVMTKYKWYNPAVEKYNQFNLGLAEQHARRGGVEERLERGPHQEREAPVVQDLQPHRRDPEPGHAGDQPDACQRLASRCRS